MVLVALTGIPYELKSKENSHQGSNPGGHSFVD